MARTTINIDKETRESLKACRKYKRQTYDEVLEQLMKDKKKVKGLAK